ncbi:16S rRNA (guanine(966)-N(2))-methyltransferase RsmD [Ruminococcus sp. Marseille-P6503]|uniref:16S rRNA (guanine(966)-N(2))-methyltransferase RsmD n=1 Tax=Ruminococcus sp. Marseille-P6503 TaxID=2364796 RepID=UPI000F52DF09|nr:16S rRNA (guanine(966)-N(2))-methyltransferase RsmD [Ruminococcus sp. Marseille-P6503]
MRVITGAARGKKLKTLDGLDVRPTSDMVKEAIFSIIQFDCPGASVLDLFAGSGQLGIEALSRGASHCVFIDKNRSAVDIVKDNLNKCGFVQSARVLNMDSLEYLKVAKPGFDIALLDPPYRTGLLEKALPELDQKMNPGGLAVCEHEKELTLNDSYGRLTVRKRYKYGKIAVTVYKIPDEEDEV